jgi:CheY-like chemotaxis protein
VRKVIAIVDDNELTRLLVRDSLSESGYEVSMHGSTVAALEAIQRELPAACIIDHAMPGMSGADLVRALRACADVRVREMPIIGLSAKFGKELVAAGVDSCIGKPFTQVALAAALRNAFTARGGPSGGTLVTLLSRFVALHHEARAGALDAPRLERYRDLRDEVARALVALQNIAVPPNVRARDALRIYVALPAEIRADWVTLRTVTADFGTGGFSARCAARLQRGDEVSFVIHASRTERIAGTAHVMSVTPDADGCRCGFAFGAVDAASVECAEMLVFDEVLRQFPTGAPSPSRWR